MTVMLAAMFKRPPLRCHYTYSQMLDTKAAGRDGSPAFCIRAAAQNLAVKDFTRSSLYMLDLERIFQG